MRTRVSLLLALFTIVCGCAFLSPPPPYDPALDAGLTALEKKVDAFFEDVIRSAGTPGATSAAFAARYEDLDREVDSLRARAAGAGGRGKSLEVFDQLRESLDCVEDAHRDGLTPAEVDIVRKLVDTQVRLLLRLERARQGAPKEGP